MDKFPKTDFTEFVCEKIQELNLNQPIEIHIGVKRKWCPTWLYNMVVKVKIIKE